MRSDLCSDRKGTALAGIVAVATVAGLVGTAGAVDVVDLGAVATDTGSTIGDWGLLVEDLDDDGAADVAVTSKRFGTGAVTLVLDAWNTPTLRRLTTYEDGAFAIAATAWGGDADRGGTDLVVTVPSAELVWIDSVEGDTGDGTVEAFADLGFVTAGEGASMAALDVGSATGGPDGAAELLLAAPDDDVLSVAYNGTTTATGAWAADGLGAVLAAFDVAGAPRVLASSCSRVDTLGRTCLDEPRLYYFSGVPPSADVVPADTVSDAWALGLPDTLPRDVVVLQDGDATRIVWPVGLEIYLIDVVDGGLALAGVWTTESPASAARLGCAAGGDWLAIGVGGLVYLVDPWTTASGDVPALATESLALGGSTVRMATGRIDGDLVDDVVVATSGNRLEAVVACAAGPDWEEPDTDTDTETGETDETAAPDDTGETGIVGDAAPFGWACGQCDPRALAFVAFALALRRKRR
ncbi:MAG: hypothetical protein V4850_21550 [Myxococcota bacterium]